MNQAEIKAQEDAARIVAITNIFDFEYTHAWGGVPYTLPVGKTLMFPFPIGDHLATHLARQALIRKAPIRDAGEIDGRGKDRPLWSDESLAELKSKILVEQYTEERKPVVSEAEAMKLKIEELNKAFADLDARVSGTPVAPAPVETTVAPVVTETVITADATTFKDKGEVIDELTKRGIKFDARKGKAELETLLAEAPAQ